MQSEHWNAEKTIKVPTPSADMIAQPMENSATNKNPRPKNENHHEEETELQGFFSDEELDALQPVPSRLGNLADVKKRMTDKRITGKKQSTKGKKI